MLRMRVQHSKLFLLPLFRNGLKWADAAAVITPNTKEVFTRKVTIGGHPLKVKKEAKLLGRLYGQNAHKHSRYTKHAKNSTISAAKMLSWLGAFQPTSTLRMAECLYISLLESVLVSRVTTCQLSDKDYHNLRATQCNICRRASWAGKRVSQYVILRETGWTPVDAAIMKAKVGLHNRLKNLGEREYQHDPTLQDERDRKGGHQGTVLRSETNLE